MYNVASVCCAVVAPEAGLTDAEAEKLPCILSTLDTKFVILGTSPCTIEVICRYAGSTVPCTEKEVIGADAGSSENPKTPVVPTVIVVVDPELPQLGSADGVIDGLD